MLLAQISLTLSCNSNLTSIVPGRSSRLHPVLVQGGCRWVLVGRQPFVRLWEGYHICESLMNSSLLLQQCPAYLVNLIWMFFVMGGRWPYSSILVSLPSIFFSIRFVSDHMVHPYSSINMTIARKKLRFILSVLSHFHLTYSLLIAVHAFAGHVLMSL